MCHPRRGWPPWPNRWGRSHEEADGLATLWRTNEGAQNQGEDCAGTVADGCGTRTGGGDGAGRRDFTTALHSCAQASSDPAAVSGLYTAVDARRSAAHDDMCCGYEMSVAIAARLARYLDLRAGRSVERRRRWRIRWWWRWRLRWTRLRLLRHRRLPSSAGHPSHHSKRNAPAPADDGSDEHDKPLALIRGHRHHWLGRLGSVRTLVT
jgi:hypothetical protein